MIMCMCIGVLYYVLVNHFFLGNMEAAIIIRRHLHLRKEHFINCGTKSVVSVFRLTLSRMSMLPKIFLLLWPKHMCCLQQWSFWKWHNSVMFLAQMLSLMIFSMFQRKNASVFFILCHVQSLTSTWISKADHTPNQDKVQAYASETLSLGLFHEEFRDAIREGDGERESVTLLEVHVVAIQTNLTILLKLYDFYCSNTFCYLLGKPSSSSIHALSILVAY